MRKLITVLLILLAGETIGGCRSVTCSTPNGYTFRKDVFLFDEKIGKMVVTLPDGSSVTLENFDANSKALDTIDKALTKIP